MSDEPPGCRERDTDGRARRWAWNAADVRGEVEQLIGGAGALVDAAVRRELTEVLTPVRSAGACHPWPATGPRSPSTFGGPHRPAAGTSHPLGALPRRFR